MERDRGAAVVVVTAVFVAAASLAAIVVLPNSALCVPSVKASAAAAMQQDRAATRPSRIATPPAGKKLRIAFVVTGFSVVIDFAGPWEVFEDVMIPSRGPTMDEQHPFQLYTVSNSTAPVRVSGGMRIVPDYTFDNAPAPNIVVVPAQDRGSPKMMAWLRRMANQSDVVMSVCTGAFILADAGLLDGKTATTHHQALERLATSFPRINVVRDKRYVQSDPVIFTAGGESSGIDLALHIVQLYFGRDAAEQTAQQMEYDGKGWMEDATDSTAPSRVVPANLPAPSGPSDTATVGMSGRWEGALRVSGRSLRVVLHVWQKDGALGATLDSVDQSTSGLAASRITLQGQELHFDVPSVGASYDGRLDQHDSTITGTWNQDGAALDLVFRRAR